MLHTCACSSVATVPVCALCACGAGGSALTRRTALRRNLDNTHVCGDVSGWKVMAQADVMCVHKRHNGACMCAVPAALCLRCCMCAGLVGLLALIEGRARRRYLGNTAVMGCNSLDVYQSTCPPPSSDKTALLSSVTSGSGWPT
jgi:hypothetical protein